MKKSGILVCFLLLIRPAIAQHPTLTNGTDYLRLIPGSAQSAFKRLELASDIDTTWNRWKERTTSW
ncbi:hypothetical protein [Larkinella knui]|uniref:Uncharacterized protein n=1 Tax=Larkinella knui TaxID=2025310 RepID=A0A3P1CQC3_9BACT|nr:hypothetical protein [Larkinella knui]RRB15475.1 hypothetical protein EHT87_13195 [Larkinella knui]